MPRTRGISTHPSVPGGLREHRDRISDLERIKPGIKEGVWHIVGDAGEPAYENSWVDAASSQPVTAFQKVGTRVWFRGAVVGGTDGTTVWTLPVGFRPVGQEPYVTNLDPQGIAKVRVYPDGRVVVASRLADVT